MSHHIVEAKNLFFSYPDGTSALENVDFRILHGESVGIIGANGAGKSTLLHLLTGIHLPSSGIVNVGDTILTKKTVAQIRKKIGLVFQNPDDQLFMNTVYEDVAFGPRNEGLSESEIEQRVNKALEDVGIRHLQMRCSHRLSGGEKRAAGIASILSMQPDILLLDEPTSYLDPMTRRHLILLLKKFTHTKIFATHDLDMVLDLCERTILLQGGKVIADGASGDILKDKALLESSGLCLPLGEWRGVRFAEVDREW